MDFVIDSPNFDDSFFGEIINNKSSKQILGRGSYGIVFQAIYKEKLAAVKLIDKSNKVKFDSLNNEANIIGWKHDNIIKLLKISITSKYGMVIMERFPGICLQLLIDIIKIPICHRICISLDISNGLLYCHKNGIIHLDIKPQNILISFAKSIPAKSNDENLFNSNRIYKCKLCDFGCSRKLSSNIEAQKYNGTIRYMSPQMLQAKTISDKDDIYALGITMWQLCSNEYPYSSINSNDIVAYRVVKFQMRPNNIDMFLNKHKLNSSILNVQTQQIDHSNNSSCAHCVLSSFDISSLRNTISKPTDFYQSNVNFIRRTPNTKDKPAMLVDFRSVDQPKKRNSIDFSDTQNEFSKNIVKKLDFSPKNSNELPPSLLSYKKSESINEDKTDNIEKDQKEFNLSKRFLIECFNVPLNYCNRNNTEQLVLFENKFQKIYEKCWHQNAVDRPNSRQVLVVLSKFLRHP